MSVIQSFPLHDNFIVCIFCLPLPRVPFDPRHTKQWLKTVPKQQPAGSPEETDRHWAEGQTGSWEHDPDVLQWILQGTACLTGCVKSVSSGADTIITRFDSLFWRLDFFLTAVSWRRCISQPYWKVWSNLFRFRNKLLFFFFFFLKVANSCGTCLLGRDQKTTRQTFFPSTTRCKLLAVINAGYFSFKTSQAPLLGHGNTRRWWYVSCVILSSQSSSWLRWCSGLKTKGM